VSVQATFAATLVDEWIRGGVTDAVVCPGSRSTPLALALAARREVRLHVRLDERGAGFFALGLGMARGRPAVVCTTSGTAAAELHPSVIEAHHAGVPVVVCTADRPPELHHVGAPQTVDQSRLYGTAVRWSCEPGVAVAGASGSWRALAARSVAEARDGPCGPGPVHLNLAFRDPLVEEPDELPRGRPDGAPWYGPATAGGGRLGGSQVAVDPGPPLVGRGVVVAGQGAGPPDAVVGLAEHLGWPLLADPRSGCRVTHPLVVAAADALARVPELRKALLPDVVVVVGAPWVSPSLAVLVAEAAAGGARVVAVDRWWRWVDPGRVVTELHRADPVAWAAAARERSPAVDDSGWAERWREAEAAAQGAIDEALAAGDDGLSEPALARALLPALPAGATAVVASSMPMRDLEWFAPPLRRPPPVLANRGANGIDGLVATTCGVAAAGRGPVVGLLGDLAFLHDVSSLVTPAGPPPPGDGCTLVVVDNGGGGIFSFLPQADRVDPDVFERLFGTPQAADVASVARGFGLPVVDVATAGELVSALADPFGPGAPAVVRARVVGRAANAALHGRIHRAAADAVRSALGA
jgi:2-succinyl-5-enolpyruvyl-6-hydroxy-3-cyclohexene-1-carboxylate synthase